MISLPSTVLDLLDEGRISIRGLIRFEFGTGTYGFIKANAPLVYGGLTYQPGGLITVSDLNSETGLIAKQFSVSLASSPDDGLTPEVLQNIESEDYRDRPVKVYDAYFHPDTNEHLFTQILMKGYVDTIEHLESTNTGYTIVANCETRALDYSRLNGRFRSDADQRRRSATDGFFVNAALRGREKIYWGSADPNTGPRRGERM